MSEEKTLICWQYKYNTGWSYNPNCKECKGLNQVCIGRTEYPTECESCKDLKGCVERQEQSYTCDIITKTLTDKIQYYLTKIGELNKKIYEYKMKGD